MSRKNFILGGILIVLIAAAYIYQGPLKSWQVYLSRSKNFLAVIELDNLDSLVINREGVTTTLEKEEKGWKIKGTKDFYAKSSVMDSLKDAFTEARSLRLELVSENKDKKEEFYTGKNGIEVKLFKDQELISNFIIGKMASDYLSTYISRPDTDKTYSVKANLFTPFNQAEWRDNTIFFTDKNLIDKIRFQYPNREFTVEKDGENWRGTIPYGFQANNEKMDKMAELMSELVAVKIPEQNFSVTGLEKHLIIIEASGEDVNNVLMIGEANEDGYYYAKKGDSDNIYLISKEQRDELDKTIGGLR